MATKKPVESKSLWFNVLSIISIASASLLADESFREIIGGYAVYLIIFVNVVNMIIRMYTVKPLEMRKEKPPPKSNLDVLDIDENQSDDSYGIVSVRDYP